MSFYNLINGVNPISVFLIPMLGEKHPDEYPRFRNVFTTDEEHPEYNGMIHIYTRVGGGNRGEGYGEEKLYDHPNFVDTFDDDYDCTYATYVFSVPDEFKEDYDKIFKNNIVGTSDAYKQRVLKVFPKLKDMLEELFGMTENKLPDNA